MGSCAMFLPGTGPVQRQGLRTQRNGLLARCETYVKLYLYNIQSRLVLCCASKGLGRASVAHASWATHQSCLCRGHSSHHNRGFKASYWLQCQNSVVE